jgi:hypothetical protein
MKQPLTNPRNQGDSRNGLSIQRRPAHRYDEGAKRWHSALIGQHHVFSPEVCSGSARIMSKPSR